MARPAGWAWSRGTRTDAHVSLGLSIPGQGAQTSRWRWYAARPASGAGAEPAAAAGEPGGHSSTTDRPAAARKRTVVARIGPPRASHATRHSHVSIAVLHPTDSVRPSVSSWVRGGRHVEELLQGGPRRQVRQQMSHAPVRIPLVFVVAGVHGVLELPARLVTAPRNMARSNGRGDASPGRVGACAAVLFQLVPEGKPGKPRTAAHGSAR